MEVIDHIVYSFLAFIDTRGLQSKILNYIFQDKQYQKEQPIYHIHVDIGEIDCQKRNDDSLGKSGQN